MTASTGSTQQAAGAAPAGHGWRAVSIVLVGASMALLEPDMDEKLETAQGEPAGIWLRVSSRGQDEQNQVPEVLAWVGSHGYTERKRYTVHGRSAFHGNRKFDESWSAVLDDMRSGAIRVLVVWKQDRIDRKLETFKMLAQVVVAGGRVEFVTQPHLNDLTTMGGRIALKVQEEIAYAESKDKSDRVKIKQSALVADGFLVGRAPWGYEVVCAAGCGPVTGKHAHGKTLALVPEGRKFIPEVFQRVCDGESLCEISVWLKRETGRDWYPKTIGEMIRNRTYMGYRQDAAGHTILEVEAVVYAEVWTRANASLDARPARGPLVPENRAMLSGVLFCARCRGPMYRVHPRQGVFYRCSGRGANSYSTHVQACPQFLLGRIVLFSDQLPRKTLIRDPPVRDVMVHVDDLNILHTVDELFSMNSSG